jgi:hypothetical protein
MNFAEIASFFLSKEIKDNYGFCNGWIASLGPINKCNIAYVVGFSPDDYQNNQVTPVN